MVLTNCGEAVFHCNKCTILTTWCLQCQLMAARAEISRLQSENSFLKKQQDEQLNKTLHLFNKYGKRYYDETPYTEPINKDNLYFLTITFDPNRFDGLGNDAAAEEVYILHSLALATKDKLIIELVGCFELQNNGNTHAHAHVRTYQPIELKQTLKRLFTNNMRNQKAIDLQPARINDKGIANAGMDYINKHEEGKGTEHKTWFTINNIKESNSEEISLPEKVYPEEAAPLLDGPISRNVYFLGSKPDFKNDLDYGLEPNIPEIKTLRKILKKKLNNCFKEILSHT